MMNTTAFLGEFLGTFLLVLSVFASGGNAFVIGGTLAVIVLMLGKISGAHVNPAISTAMYLKGSLTNQEYLMYVASQVLGGVASLYTYRMFA
jgi:glycerol uptake facilitator-like aquaporin